MTPILAHHAQALTAESPLWDAGRGVLWYIDIQGQRLLGHRPGGGEAPSFMLPLMPGFVVPGPGGALILGLENGLWRLDPGSGDLAQLVPVEAGDARTRLNEGKADAQGRLWFGSMDKTGPYGAIGALYRHRAADGITHLRGGVGIPNGIETSLDGRRLYFTDSRLRQIFTFPLDPASGEIGAAEVLATYPEGEVPDGATLDAEGALWVTVVGASRIDRLAPDGTRIASLAVPVSRPTSLCFGGPDLSTLYVTSQRRFLSHDELRRQPLAGALIALPGAGQRRLPHAAAFG